MYFSFLLNNISIIAIIDSVQWMARSKQNVANWKIYLVHLFGFKRNIFVVIFFSDQLKSEKCAYIYILEKLSVLLLWISYFFCRGRQEKAIVRCIGAWKCFIQNKQYGTYFICKLKWWRGARSSKEHQIEMILQSN